MKVRETSLCKINAVQADFGNAKSTGTLKVDHSAHRSRLSNDELRGKRHLTPVEVDQTCKAISDKLRNPDRVELTVLMAFHHRVRGSELTNVKRPYFDLRSGQIGVKRMKNGIDTTHSISEKRELMILRRIYRNQEKPKARFVFRNERGSAVSVKGFQKMFGKFSEIALGVKWNSHSLRHA